MIPSRFRRRLAGTRCLGKEESSLQDLYRFIKYAAFALSLDRVARVFRSSRPLPVPPGGGSKPISDRVGQRFEIRATPRLRPHITGR